MAESFLFSIAESLIGKVASRAYEEASLVLGVYDDLREFKQTVLYIKQVLVDAEKKQDNNHELREWLKQIKHVFSDAENVLDEVECEALRKQVVRTYGTTKTKVDRFFSTSNPLVFRCKIAKQIREIKKRLDGVAANRNNFGLERIDVDRRGVHRRDMTYSHVLESDVIGREHDKEEIIQQLLMQHNPRGAGDKSISVLPIQGIGGMGKTTLAKLVFHDKRITDSFQMRMWVCVSDDFDLRQLVIKIISCADEFAPIDARVGQQNLMELNMEQLTSHLTNKIVGQKFLLVLDDVWNEDLVKWVQLRDLLQVATQGSKVLVTTRSHAIASMMGTISPYILKGLPPNDSLSLLLKWAFKEGEDEKHPDLVIIGREIVKKCKGVPLAIRTLGSLLFSKHDTSEWEFVRNNKIWNLPQKENDILPSLKLSYDQLPSYLKQCLALFSLFPKGFLYTSPNMTSIWGALGLIASPNKSQTLEDIANQYLNELISRSLIQQVMDFGIGYAFTIHDLVHDLALYVAKDECLLVNSNIQNIPESVKHLSFVENNILAIESSTPKSADVKTILFPIKGIGAKNVSLLNTWASSYKFLRFLDLSDSTFETLPRCVCKLKHLRYLCLHRNQKIKRLPDSICMLQNLLDLCLGGCTELETLPKKLRNLISLRSLDITTKQSVFLESDIANLGSLEVLSFGGCDNLESLFVGTKLPTLRTLSIASCKRLKSLPLDTNHFPQLKSLVISRCTNLELSDKNSNLRLKFLCIRSLPQLAKTLPHWLQGSTSTLQGLWIQDCYNLEALPEWLSKMVFLKSFIINGCPKLNSLPDDIHCLTALEFFGIKGCPELGRKCQPQVGEYWSKISHIKQIIIDGSRIKANES